MRVVLRKMLSESIQRNKKPYHRLSKQLRANKLLAYDKVSLFYFSVNLEEFHIAECEDVSGAHTVWHDKRKDLWQCTCEAYVNWNEKECTHMIACKKLIEQRAEKDE